jgi:hypothetical protein
MAGANEVVAELRASGVTDAHAYFKASCPECGERCVFDEPDVIYEEMTCSTCGSTFPFVEGNYMITTQLLPRMTGECRYCGADIWLIETGKDWKWLTDPQRWDSCNCRTPDAPARSHEPEGARP